MRRFQIGVLRRGPIANHLAPHTGLARVIASRWVRAGCLFGIAISLCSWGLAYGFMSNSIAALTVDRNKEKEGERQSTGCKTVAEARQGAFSADFLDSEIPAYPGKEEGRRFDGETDGGDFETAEFGIAPTERKVGSESRFDVLGDAPNCAGLNQSGSVVQVPDDVGKEVQKRMSLILNGACQGSFAQGKTGCHGRPVPAPRDHRRSRLGWHLLYH